MGIQREETNILICISVSLQMAQKEGMNVKRRD